MVTPSAAQNPLGLYSGRFIYQGLRNSGQISVVHTYDLNVIPLA